MSKADFIQFIIGRIFEDPQTVTASWALRVAFPPASAPRAPHEPKPVKQPGQPLFRLLTRGRPNPEVERLSRSFDRLAAEHQSLKKEFQELQAQAAALRPAGPAEFARLMAIVGTRPAAAPQRNPWHQWIAAHQQELEKHRGMVLAIDHEQGIVASGADHEELSSNLQKYLEGQRLHEEIQARLLITHASFYIDDV